jgi:hypothetical protein
MKKTVVEAGRIAFDEHHKRFFVTGTNQVLRGLHGVLTQKFYPLNSTYENTRSRKFVTKSGKKLPGLKGRKTIRTARRAKNLGARVDEHIRKLVRAADGDAMILRAWTDVKGSPSLATFVSKKKKIPKMPLKRVEPEAKAAIRHLLDNDWIPIECQYPVGSIEHGIATKPDVACKHAKEAKRRMIVEVKTGYDGTWLADTRQKLNKPLDKFWDTMRNKAHLQVACTGILEKQSRGVLPEMFVLRVSETALGPLEPLDPWMQANLKAIGMQLVSTPAA